MREWFLETRETYFANPTARRDFRTQLRGIKPILLWTTYLLMLIFVGISYYSSLGTSDESSIALLQGQLKTFYATVLSLLASAVVLITPALTASAVASERQRRSLDLILSTPLHIKSYLVGKLLASYRYTWMLLLLSLPLVSMCVILGGATWIEVIVAFVRLSLFGLLFTSIGLLMSVLAPRPVSAIAYSYTAVGFYVFVSALAASLGAGSGAGSGLFLAASLNPFFDGMMLASGSFIGDFVLSWAPLAILVGVSCKLLLLGAGSALGGYRSKHTVSLRWHLLFVSTLAVGLMARQLPDSILLSAGSILGSTPTGHSPGFDQALGVAAGGLLCTVAILFHWLLPFAACHAPMSERRFQNDGLFRLRQAFVGTPSGALPFVLILGVSAFATIIGVYSVVGVQVRLMPIVDGALWSLAFLTLVWAICRFTSVTSRNLTTARGATFVMLICLLLLPTPILQALAEIDGSDEIWKLHPFHSALIHADNRIYMAGVMALIAGLFVLASVTIAHRSHRNAQVKTA